MTGKPLRIVAERVQSAITAYTAARDAITYRRADCQRHGRTGTEAQLLPHYDRLLHLGDQQLTAAHHTIAEQVVNSWRQPRLSTPPPPEPRVYRRRHDVLVVLQHASDEMLMATDVTAAADLKPAVHDRVHAAQGLLEITFTSMQRIDAANVPALSRRDAWAMTRGLAASIRPRVPATHRSGMGTALNRGAYPSALVDIVGAILAHTIPVTTVERYILRHLVTYYRRDDRVNVTPDIVDAMPTAGAT
ncbi:MAG: hypothetical protein ACRD0P_15295 [Stackebrandtia sp.]